MELIMHNTKENVPFMLNLHTNIIREKLDTIYSLASITRRAEESVEDIKQDGNLITILKLVEDIASDFESVYEVERLIEALPKDVLETNYA